MTDKSTILEELLPGQLDLIPTKEIERVLVAREIATGRHTGAGLRAKDPDKFRVVCEAIAESTMSGRQIAAAFHVSRNLVAALTAQPELVEPHKKKLAGQFRGFAGLCVERAQELVLDDSTKLTVKDLLIAGAVAVDKAQLLTGQATVITETIDGSAAAGDFEEQAAALAAMPAADVIELGITGDMDPEREEPTTKGPGCPAPGIPDLAAQSKEAPCK